MQTTARYRHLSLRITLLTILIIHGYYFSFPLKAQSQGGLIVVRGKVVDVDTKEALPYATVSLFQLQDSSLVSGGITEENGTFSLDAKAGNYYLTINFMGYASKKLNDLRLNAGLGLVNLGEIAIEAQTTDLEEVIVQGEKDLVELALDKKVFNVSQDPINAGRNAADILGNLPSVTVDGEGNVSLRGSDNVQILIDGKPSGLLSFDGAEGLRQLQGGLVDNVEIITNPSARYQAEGMAGIINIVLKKEQSKGINGSFDFTAGQPDNYGAAINLNYRRENLNFFINYGLIYRNIENPYNTLYQEVYGEDTTFITRQKNIGRQTVLNNNIQLGADYFFNENNILTTSFTYRHAKGKRNTEIEYMDYLFTDDNLQSITRRYQDEDETEPNLEYSLNYKRNFGSEDHELTAILTYIDNWEESDQLYTQKSFTPENLPSGDPDELQRSYNYETEKQLLLQADYVYPFGAEGKFETGIRNTLRDITNDFLVTAQQDDAWIPLEGLDNDFYYDENIYAAYMIVGNKTDKLGYQLGLRGEYTDLTTELLQTAEVNQRDYFNLFPSAHFTYDLPNEHALQLSYSRRLHRPTYNDLTPFVTFFDNRNFFSGNPDLNPEYTHSIEAGHIKYFETASISSALYYRHTDDKILRIREVNEEGESTTRPYNLVMEDAYGAEFITSYQPIAWWKMDLNLNFYRAIIDGTNLDQSFESDTYTWFGRLNSRFTLWGNTDLQLRASYEAPQQTPQGRQLAIAFLDVAITRDVFNNNGTLTLNVVDVFRSNRDRSITEGDIFYTRRNSLRTPRQINLTLNYRLNQSKKTNEK
ncbi:ferric enterobactin receptor [Catalinimonas alkaloidigena]|uniref:outer membrane beta-barrel family protein n=1 Tax=Catalinimonas alkaloidigena TaxID=1075417 RepID=UPI0024068C72|nr:outer membrane beta-barrel family protein [Catalinimonas alkaloidigena]MDF9796605.1 ferric enterobactin receptor [Catalinimonas alkaloidigena]